MNHYADHCPTAVKGDVMHADAAASNCSTCTPFNATALVSTLTDCEAGLARQGSGHLVLAARGVDASAANVAALASALG